MSRPSIVASGLSPRVRGNHALIDGCRVLDGSIPARAGEPPRRPRPKSTSIGLSPRVRGSHVVGKGDDLGGGSIPACAGEPDETPRLHNGTRVYPRVCGGIGLVFNHQPGDGNGLVDRQSTTDHALKGPGPPAEV